MASTAMTGQALARARYVRTSATKARRVVDMVRGLPTAEADAILRFAPQGAAEPVRKVLLSAVANAEHNDNLDRNALWVSEAYVDEGPTYKRIQPRAMGRAFRVRKRTSHITVVVGAPEDGFKATKARVTGSARKPVVKKTAAKKATARTAAASKGRSS